jgi:hypothetical protein
LRKETKQFTDYKTSHLSRSYSLHRLGENRKCY